MTTEHKVMGGIGLLSLAIIVGGVWLFDKQGVESEAKISRPLMGEKIADVGSTHVKEGESHKPYNSNPPTSGPHIGNAVAGPGIKTESVPDELVLHSMEHGAAVVWYRDDLAESEVNKIKNAFESASGKKILIPRKDLEVPVALVSWGYMLKLETVDEVKIKEFIETNNDRAPEKAPI